MIMPADSISGGFGEDIMVAGLLNSLDCPVAIFASVIEPRFFLGKDVMKVEYGKGYFVYTMFAWLMRKYSDYYIIGADILDGIYDSNVLRFKTAKIAKRMGARVHITSFSIRETPSDYFIENIKSIATNVVIMGRDPQSSKRLESILNKPVKVSADIAFLCGKPNIKDIQTEKLVEAERKSGRKVVAYCPNTIHAKKIGLSTYIKRQESLLKMFVELNCSILFLYHDLRNYALNLSDRDLAKMLSVNFAEHGIFVDGIKDGHTMKYYISLADFTVTGRMHFGISGYTLGLPMFGVSYYGKFDGLQEMLGIAPEETLVPYDMEETSPDIVVGFLERLHSYKEAIQTNIKNVTTSALCNVK